MLVDLYLTFSRIFFSHLINLDCPFHIVLLNTLRHTKTRFEVLGPSFTRFGNNGRLNFQPMSWAKLDAQKKNQLAIIITWGKMGHWRGFCPFSIINKYFEMGPILIFEKNYSEEIPPYNIPRTVPVARCIPIFAI